MQKLWVFMRVDSNSCGPVAEEGAKTARLAQSTRAHKKTVSVEIRWRALAWSWRRGAENTASVKSDNGFD